MNDIHHQISASTTSLQDREEEADVRQKHPLTLALLVQCTKGSSSTNMIDGSYSIPIKGDMKREEMEKVLGASLVDSRDGARSVSRGVE